MATAYLYSGAAAPETPALLAQKIEGEVNALPTVQKLDSYLYIEFGLGLSSDAKAVLDDFVAARGGVFADTDDTPSAGIAGIAQSPDGSYWKLTVTDLGNLVPVKIA
jgi:hypothetical protein